MMNSFRSLLAVAFLMTALPAAAAPVTEVTVIATIHGLHKKSTTYSYEALYALVKNINPDYVGVEIRPEDMARDADYLAESYPTEMIHFAKEGAPRAFGFDWLGDELAGAPIASDWWAKRSPIKKLEREMDADTALSTAALDAVQAQEMAVIKDATAAGMNDGRYDRLRDDYYRLYDALVRGTKYQPLMDFYQARDRHIDAAILSMIKAHPGAKIVILTGADHRSPLIRYLTANAGADVKLMPVP